MALLFSTTIASTGPEDVQYTQEFTSTTQPMFIALEGDFTSPDRKYQIGSGYVTVQFQMQSGKFVDCSDMTYRQNMQDSFRFPPGGVGRVKVVGCKELTIEMHDSSITEG